MARFAPACTLALLLLGVGTAQSQNLLDGFSVRLSYGFDVITGLDDLNGYVADLNTYYGEEGFWAFDAAGGGGGFGGSGNDPFGGWRPNFRMDNFSVKNPSGIQIEKVVRATDYTRILAGIEYSAGSRAISNQFDFTVQGGIDGSIEARESIDLSTVMVSGRFSLQDPNLPLHSHIGIGLGSSTLEAQGLHRFSQTSFVTSEFVELQRIEMNHDKTAFAGKIFVGLEYLFGGFSVILDGGYNFLDFGELDGTTKVYLGSAIDGQLYEVEVLNAPETRYNSLELSRLLYNTARTNLDPTGRPPATIDFNVAPAYWAENPVTTPEAMEFNLSGGFAKVSFAFNF